MLGLHGHAYAWNIIAWNIIAWNPIHSRAGECDLMRVGTSGMCLHIPAVCPEFRRGPFCFRRCFGRAAGNFPPNCCISALIWSRAFSRWQSIKLLSHLRRGAPPGARPPVIAVNKRAGSLLVCCWYAASSRHSGELPATFRPTVAYPSSSGPERSVGGNRPSF